MVFGIISDKGKHLSEEGEIIPGVSITEILSYHAEIN
jgi:hypothetical protein